MSKPAKKTNLVAVCTDIATPVAEAMGLTLWDVRFDKEGGDFFLRYFIDKPEGVGIGDCEQFSRAVDKLLDEADPIEQGYFLEVSSPGTERTLKSPHHFEAFMGRKIVVKLYGAVEGRREFVGRLDAYDEATKSISITDQAGEAFTFQLSDVSTAKQYAEYNFKGADR